MSFEFAQLKEQRLAYFKDVWNLLDSSQFAFYTLLFIIKISSQFTSDTLPEQLLQSLLLIQSFNKILYYLRMWEGPNYIITIMTLVLGEVIPFLLIVLVAMVCLSKMYITMHLGLNPPEEYKNFNSNSLIAMMIMIYKSNKGDVFVPSLSTDFTNRTQNSPALGNFFLFMNVFLWIFQQMLFIFFGGTFTIRILQAYELFNKTMKSRMYRTKAKLNSENFDIMDNFLKSRTFKVICFSFDKKLKWDTFSEWNGFVGQVENKMMVLDHENSLKKEEHDKALEEKHKILLETKSHANDLHYKLQELTKKLKWVNLMDK